MNEPSVHAETMAGLSRRAAGQMVAVGSAALAIGSLDQARAQTKETYAKF